MVNLLRHIYNCFKNIDADPVEDPEELWLKRSVVLFTDNKEHEKYATKQDLLDDVYTFITMGPGEKDHFFF
ncbi:hypothetical protein HPULCUR_009023 [Helicostylum pulchrum]|uniref:Uncharacterized protein n=1 Tax=Helicostylum pulchrum TaxID=562976 RepID=A0ABP9Y9A9_9FUNG